MNHDPAPPAERPVPGHLRAEIERRIAADGTTAPHRAARWVTAGCVAAIVAAAVAVGATLMPPMAPPTLTPAAPPATSRPPVTPVPSPPEPGLAPGESRELTPDERQRDVTSCLTGLIDQARTGVGPDVSGGDTQRADVVYARWQRPLERSEEASATRIVILRVEGWTVTCRDGAAVGSESTADDDVTVDPAAAGREPGTTASTVTATCEPASERVVSSAVLLTVDPDRVAAVRVRLSVDGVTTAETEVPPSEQGWVHLDYRFTDDDTRASMRSVVEALDSRGVPLPIQPYAPGSTATRSALTLDLESCD